MPDFFSLHRPNLHHSRPLAPSLTSKAERVNTGSEKPTPVNKPSGMKICLEEMQAYLRVTFDLIVINIILSM